MTDANLDTSLSNGGDEQSPVPTYEIDGQTYPCFPFDEPVTVKLLDGTVHKFKMWTDPIERQREDLLKSIVTTSPANVHGENPMDIKTDYTRSTLRYYSLMIEAIGGIQLPNGEQSNGSLIPANKIVEGVTLPNGQPAKVVDLLRVATRRTAASRLYGGKIEVEKPNVEDDEGIDYDPFDIDSLDLTKEIEKSQSKQQIQILSLSRIVPVRQELGVEQLPSGQFTKPTHVIRYSFLDPDGDDFSKWELKAQRGFAIQLRKGGTRAETYYNLDTINSLFNKLIDKIEGATIEGRIIDLPSKRDDEMRLALLSKVPPLIKKNTIVQLFREANQLGNV